MHVPDDPLPSESAIPFAEPVEVLPVAEPVEGLPIAPPRRQWSVVALCGAIVAWCAIFAGIGLILLEHYWEPSSLVSGPHEDLSLIIMRTQGRHLVGTASFAKSAGADIYQQAQMLNTGNLAHRLRFVVLAGELAGPQEAKKLLEQLNDKIEKNEFDPTVEQESVLKTLNVLYTEYSKDDFTASSVSDSDRQVLRRDLDWFGDLALAPQQTPDKAARQAIIHTAVQTSFMIIGLVVAMGLVGLLGFVGLVIFLIFLFSGKLRTGIRCGSRHGGVYAETFAIYLYLYFGLSYALAKIPGLDDWHLLLGSGAALFSLVTLTWPLIRGVSWKQVRQDIGWNLGRQPALEPFLGLGGYAMTLPLLAIGLLVMFVMIVVSGGLKGLEGLPFSQQGIDPESFPVHPIVFVLLKSDWSTRLQIYFLACVVAPVVEETMFRGVLYRHLREATNATMGFFLSVMCSALVVSFIFAVIHPQGVIAVPALMALAFGFSLIREWRGTLLPGMVAHGVNNALVTTIVIVVLGS